MQWYVKFHTDSKSVKIIPKTFCKNALFHCFIHQKHREHDSTFGSRLFSIYIYTTSQESECKERFFSGDPNTLQPGRAIYLPEHLYLYI